MKYMDKEHETAMKFYNEGYNDRMIAEAMYIDVSTVYAWRKRNGLGRSTSVRKMKSNYTPENIEKIRELKAQGKTDREIAMALGVSHSTVKAYRQRAGIQKYQKRKARTQA